jgi:hypothetical protein
MHTKPARLSGSMPSVQTGSDIEDQSERHLVTGHSYQPPATQIETDQRKWNSCQTWKDAVQLNAQFFAGRLEVNIDSTFNPMDMENETLHMLLNHIYVIRHHPRRLDKGYTQDGKAFITRQRGSCCFMLPYDDKLLAPLTVALLESQQLSTAVLHTESDDFLEGSLYNFNCNIRVKDIRSGLMLDDLDPWSSSTTESLEEVHSELIDVWKNLHGLGCNALLSSHPVLFRVRTCEYGTDVLSLLSEIIEGELKRHSFSYVCNRYKLVQEQLR